MYVILAILLLVLLLGGGLGYSGGWHSNYPGAYWGGGGLGLVLIIIVVVLVFRGL